MKPAAAAIGDRFGKWEALERIPGNKHKHPQWVCRCSCGTVKSIDQDNLTSGRTTSCGCVKHVNGMLKHGMNCDPLMGVWRNMISRCTKPGNKQFHDYGGRGISVHPSWMVFDKFMQDVGPHPGSGLTFDRIDNDGNYEPGNVRWATWAQQTRNKRTNVMVEYEGRSMCLQDWAHELGVTAHHLYRRETKGMTWQQAITDIIENPPVKRGKYSKISA